MSNPAIVFALPGHEALGKRLVAALAAEEGQLTVRQFPDGETYVRGETACDGRHAVLAANLYQPNAQFLPLMYCVQGVRVLGASRVILVTPYLPYMRQDARFKPGEVITSRIFASLLSSAADGLVTVDPHLHRYTSLAEIYSIPTCIEHAAAPVTRWIQSNIERPLIVGPDDESAQWTRVIAEMVNAPSIVLEKRRHGDRDVEVSVPPRDRWIEHTPVLFDDIISTAQTMAQTVIRLRKAGYRKPVCVGVHAVFAEGALEILESAGVEQVITCNTIEHPTNDIDITGVLARGIQRLLNGDIEGDK